MQKKNFLPILALAVGHLVTDLQAGALPIVLPHLKELFTLSYSQLAAIVLTQNITSSVIQPVFGYITDKRSMPVLLPFCAAMAGAWFAAIGWVSGPGSRAGGVATARANRFGPLLLTITTGPIRERSVMLIVPGRSIWSSVWITTGTMWRGAMRRIISFPTLTCVSIWAAAVSYLMSSWTEP